MKNILAAEKTVSNNLSPEENKDSSTSYYNSGDTEHTGDKPDYNMKDKNKAHNNHSGSING